MARRSYVQVPGVGLVPKEDYRPTRRDRAGPYIVEDIKPFVTVCGDIAGSEITSRSKLREFEKRNGLVQVGSDKSFYPKRDKQRDRKEHYRAVRRELENTWSKLTK